ncbi:MAG: CRISPR-associated endonuclease Cas1 [Patescibacteria group bacterium]|nr:CRISPR-associated endonuclease Cas1 [Patescibacteria group bacterium]
MKTDLLIDTYGTKIGCSGERIVLSFPKVEEKKEYPIRRLDKIVVLRPASLTTNAVQLALEHDVDIVYLGAFGKPVGRIFSSEPRGLASLRKAQLEVSNDPEKSFELARAFVKGKCANQISHMRLLGYRYKKDFSKELLQAQTILDSVDFLPATDKSKEQLLGIEGYIADRYFACIRKICRFPGRIPQGRDKFNSMLNYGYGILYNEVERTCLYVGLDPYLGLYHSERYGKPALVLDLVEEFRVPIVDMAIFPIFASKEIGKRKYFEKTDKNQYQLSPEGKALVVEAVMKHIYREARWNGKEYAMKRIIENQIRALARHFTGRESKYVAFDTTGVLPIENPVTDEGR